MLNKHTTYSVVALAKRLQEQKVNVAPASEMSIIGSLVKAFPYDYEHKTIADIFVAAVESSKSYNSLDVPHDGMMIEYAQQIKQVLNKRLTFIRQDLIPFVGDLTAKIEAKIKEADFITPEIIEVADNDLMASESLLNLTSYHTAGDLYKIAGLIGMETRSAKDIKGLLETGSPQLNAEIAEAIEKVDMTDGALETIFSRFFSQQEQISTSFSYDEHVLSYPFVEKVVVYLIARNIQARNIIDASEKSDLSVRRNVLATLVNALGYRINRIINKHRECLADIGLLILDNAKAQNKIYVNAAAYKHYLSELGGSPEAIFGAVANVEKTPWNYRTSTIVDKTQILENYWDVTWNSKISQLEASRMRDSYVGFSEVISAMFKKDDEDNNEKRTINGMGDLRGLLQVGFDEFERSYIRHRSIDRVIMDLVCQHALNGLDMTNFLIFLNNANSGQDARELMYRYVIRDLTDHYAQTLTYQKAD